MKSFFFFRTISLISNIIGNVKKLVFFLERGKAAPRQHSKIFLLYWRYFFIVPSSGIMKRNILKKLGLSKKWGLGLMLAGLAALNVGFTTQNNNIEAAEVAQVKGVDILPTTPASVADFSLVKNVNDEIETQAEIIAAEQNIVEKSYGYDGDYVAVMTMEATAYLPSDGDGYGITATGIPATYGVAAVDPAVIPLGSRLYIPGYGEAIAADTGGAIYGYRIDLCMESYSEAMNFGRRDVTVYVLR